MNCPECKTKKFVNYKDNIHFCIKCEKMFSIKEINLDWRTKIILTNVIKKSMRKKKTNQNSDNQ